MHHRVCTILLTLCMSTPFLAAQKIRSPEISSNGRLVFEQNGDIWLLEHPFQGGSEVKLQRLTSDPAWDQDPTWDATGKSILFASDREGGFSIWKLSLSEGKASHLERITQGPAPDAEPATDASGRLVFVRGRGPERDLWMRSTEGDLAPLVSEPGADFSPRISPDGMQLLYLAERNGRTEVRLYAFKDGSTDKILTGIPALFPRWSPDGTRIAFATRGQRGGLWLIPVDGSYQNLLTRQEAAPAWAPDGKRMILGALPPPEVSYNGDPARLVPRHEASEWSSELDLLRIRVPPAPDSSEPRQTTAQLPDAENYRVSRFDRVQERLARLYYSEGSKKDEWEALAARYRDLALAATSDEELEDVIYRMLAERPTINQPARGHAGVSSANPLATAAGLEMLEKGGNVVDAAVAVSFALGVVEPDASGVGGYGEMVLYLKRLPKPVVIEFLTRVPEAADLSNASFLEQGNLPSDGPVLVNVPGTVAGMWQAWSSYGSGKLEWKQLLQPAIRLAEEGFQTDDAFTTTLFREQTRFRKYPSSRTLFFPEGAPLKAGQHFKNPDLAWTLRKIAEGGRDGFYKGDVARKLVEDLHGQGSPITLQDLERYFAVERRPVSGTYRGHTIYSAAPAASGGASLVAKLNLLENVDATAPYTSDPQSLHAMIEAWKLQPSSNGRLADPSLWPIDLTPFVDKDYTRRIWESCFQPDHATTPEDLASNSEQVQACARVEKSAALSWGSDYPECPSPGCRPATGTTAFAVGDAEGNLVAVTQTLGTWGGNFYVTPGLGFLYNDKLRSYRSNSSQYGARLPFARNGTSIAPTLIFKGEGEDRKPYLAVGAAGNSWITSAVYQIVVAVTGQGVPLQEAIELPRFLVNSRRVPGSPSRIREVMIEMEDGISPRILQQLESMGHEFELISETGEVRMGYASAVAIEGDHVVAAADPRRSGQAGALP